MRARHLSLSIHAVWRFWKRFLPAIRSARPGWLCTRMARPPTIIVLARNSAAPSASPKPVFALCNHKNWNNGKKNRGCVKYRIVPTDYRLSLFETPNNCNFNILSWTFFWEFVFLINNGDFSSDLRMSIHSNVKFFTWASFNFIAIEMMSVKGFSSKNKNNFLSSPAIKSDTWTYIFSCDLTNCQLLRWISWCRGQKYRKFLKME